MSKVYFRVGIACLLVLVFAAGCSKKDDSAPINDTSTTVQANPPGPVGGAPQSGGSASSGAATSAAPDLTVLKVKNALVTNKEKLGIEHLQVDSAGSTITIKGSVKNEHLKALADSVAKPVAGGKAIKNELTVSGG